MNKYSKTFGGVANVGLVVLALLGAEATSNAYHSYLAQQSQLTDLFQCAAPVHGYINNRAATLVDVKDPATGKAHIELRLEQPARQADGAQIVSRGTAQYPNGYAGVKSGIAGAVEFCTHGTAGATFAPA